MKHSKLFVLLTALFFAGITACNSEKDKEEDAAAKAGTETPAAEAEKKKTEISVGPDGAGIKTKSGEEVKVNKDGSSVETKDVKIKLNTKDTTKRQ